MKKYNISIFYFGWGYCCKDCSGTCCCCSNKDYSGVDLD